MIQIIRTSIFLLFASITFTAVAGEPNDSDPSGTPGISSTKPSDGISVQVDDVYLVPYTETIPGTDVTFEMVPIPGGTFLLGSSTQEAGHRPDEGPQIAVDVSPMWIGQYEVTQREYREFEFLYHVFYQIDKETGKQIDSENDDGVTAPTPLYSPRYVYEYGRGPEFPAVSMTQYAAQQYTKWLGGLTKRQYRLPSEAEWEYACRTGSKGRFCCPDNEIENYAWFFDNAPKDGFSTVGKKRPNAFGLHDMHGNVGEWTVNAYTKDGYQWLEKTKEKPFDPIDTIRWPEQIYPCVVRGGDVYSKVNHIRSAARLESTPQWQDEDPGLPQSPWWQSSGPAKTVGFRLARSYRPLIDQEITKFWDHTCKIIHEDVAYSILNGRGRIGLIDENLLPAVEAEKRVTLYYQLKRAKELKKRRESRPGAEE